jgi:hypothetical protein
VIVKRNYDGSQKVIVYYRKKEIGLFIDRIKKYIHPVMQYKVGVYA